METYNIIISTILNKNPWKLKKIDIYKEDGSLLFSIEDLPEEIMAEKRFFYFNYPSINTNEVVNKNGKQIFFADWSISLNSIRVDAMIFIILELTNTKLVYKATPVIGSDGTYTYAQYTYERTAN